MPTPEIFLGASAPDNVLESECSSSTASSSTSALGSSSFATTFATCVDRASTFFTVLTAPFLPFELPEPRQALSPDPTNSYGSDEPYVDLPWTDEEADSTTVSDATEVSIEPALPRGYWPSVLARNIYTPHGKWSWAEGKSIDDIKHETLLHSDSNTCSVSIHSGSLDGRRIQYISKSWVGSQAKSEGFFTELALYKCQLKPLQGKVVPSIIGVYTAANRLNVAIEPPHPSFWIEASSDMPHVLKRRCVEAFQQIHNQGVLHGDVELCHMLIGGDAKVTIIDFQGSRTILPNEKVELGKATPEEIEEELKRVKAKLRYGDAMAGSTLASQEYSSHHATGWSDSSMYVDDVKPRRFVMPGQTAAQLEDAIRHFLHIIDELVKAESSLGGPTPPATPPPGPDPDEIHILHASSISKEGSSPRSPYLLRKRLSTSPYSSSPALRSRVDRVQEDREIRGYQLRKRKEAPTGTRSSTPPKRSRRGGADRSSSHVRGETSAEDGKSPSAADHRPETNRPSTILRRHNALASLSVPERLPSLDPLTPSPLTPSPDPLLLTPRVPPSGSVLGSSSQLSEVPDATLSSLKDSPSSPSSPKSWSADPYNDSRAHDNYTKLFALAAKRNIPRFKPAKSSRRTFPPPPPRLRLAGEESRVDDTGSLTDKQTPTSGVKRKRDEDTDAERYASSSSHEPRTRGPKVLKWSDGAETQNLAPSGPPLRIRSILKKHNPPAIRSYEMSRIAELTEDGDESEGVLTSHSALTVEDVDKLNDGSKDLDEELNDDLDMMIDAQDSDENFLNGYPLPTGTVPSLSGTDIGTQDKDNPALHIQKSSEVLTSHSGHTPPITADNASDTSPTPLSPDGDSPAVHAGAKLESTGENDPESMSRSGAAELPVSKPLMTGSSEAEEVTSSSQRTPHISRSLGWLGTLFRF